MARDDPAIHQGTRLRGEAFLQARRGADSWREHFSVDIVNGVPAHELKCDNRKLVACFLRVGLREDGAWRTFGLRKDFNPAAKLQMEDDITASIVVPADRMADRRSEGASCGEVRPQL